MNLFGRLFKKNRVELDDPVFGLIRFEQGIWEFIPDSGAEQFMILVVAPEAGPSPVQRDFFLAVRSKWSYFEERAREFLRAQVESDVDVSRLVIYSVEIGTDDECRREQFVLELSEKRADVIHRVSFEGPEPVQYGMDH